MAAATNRAISGIPRSPVINKEDENNRPPTVEEILIQVENHLYKSPEHRASLLIAAWSCLGSGTASFRNIENVFRMLYRETAMMIFGGHWPKINIMYKRGLSRALIQYSHSMGVHIKGSEGMCSALVMAAYDAWGDPSIHMLLSQQEINLNLVSEFVKSEPRELLLIRVECLVKAHCEEAAIRILKCSLQCLENPPPEDECGYVENWRLAFKEWLLRLLFRKRRLNDLIAESSSYSCHDGVRLIRQTFHSDMEDSESLTETLINLFLVRDLLFQSTYCCTAELMRLWCELQAKNKKSPSEIQEAACKLLVGHASSSAQFYLFVDILWEKFGASLLPLYLEMYIRGLTSDLNFLEAARQADNKEYVIEIENHMAAMYFKLFSLFNSINKEVALECLMSAFSLDPTKERLEWIKKLSLQITKEKAIKNTNREDSKHKSCSRSGCPHNCVHHPSPVKRKAVVMCDQAIQVGDDLAEVEALVKDPDTNNQGSCDIRPVSCDNLDPVIESKVTNESDTNSCVNVDKEDILCKDIGKTFSELNHSDKVEEIKVSGNENGNNECDKRPTVDVVNLSQDTGQASSTVNLSGIGVETKAAKQEDYEGNLSSVNDSVDIKSDIKDIHTSSKLENKLEVFNSVENHLKHKNKVKHTSFSAHNHISESDKQVENNCLSFSIDKLVLPCKTDKVNSLSQSHKSTERINANCIIDKMEIETSVSSDLKNCFSIDKSIKQTPNTTTPINETLCPDENVKNQTNMFINGYRETEHIINEDDKNNLNLNEKHIIENQEMLTDSKDLNPEINEPTTFKIQPIANGNETMQNCILNLQDSSDVLPEKSIEGFTSENPKETNLNFNTMEPRVTRRSEALKNLNLDRFSHIVLDSKIPDLSSEALSDLVAVLESLRNRQLKSSCKWSQIKHLFENYLENIVTLRCSIMNNQAYGSMDSETDSVSELTTDGFKDLDFPQSQESVVEDPFVNKTHVLKRFMNSDKATEMATYVNLSDIHCPQIPLEKLFYTDHSSSHVGHKKRHKRHRNHENKVPEKLALKKFRHGSRAERDLIKRKKRKKRKAKKGKGHTKKHCFTHGKITKSYVKNKKKKHKLKKKKDGNSGFISGDYCSDFSSEKLMQLVKEHSNSYSKMPATTSKHPYTSALVTRSASSSDLSEEPLKKKQKVGFSKKRSHSNKHRDKHKHIKKSSKRKKTIVVETCGAGFNDVINEGDMGNNIESVKDYSHFVQYSSVKKMEAVQIRQRSVALNLSKVNNKSHNLLPSSNNPCIQNPQLQEFVHQKFESYSPEDLMKMQLMMSDQQTNVPAMSNSISAANNQAVLKYFTTKTTSRLMSVAEANALGVLGSDSEASKSPIPPFSDNSNVQKITTIHPTNLPPNVKHLIISGNTAYQVPNSTSVTTVSSIIPINFSGNTYSNIAKYTGTAHPTSVKTSTNATSPQVTTFTIPVNHPMGSRLIGNKLVIPLPPCGHVNKTTSSSLALLPAVTSTYASLQGNPPNVILVKSGTNTQLIQQPGLSSSLLNNTKFMPIARNISTNPLVTKTAPKLIKQATKRLTQPLIKRPVVKTQLFPNAVTNKPADKTMLKVVDSSGKISPITTLDAGKSQIEPTPESLLVQRAIEEAKRAIAESAPDKLHETKRGSKSKKENAEEKFLPKARTSEVKVVSESIKDGKSEQPENKELPAPSNFEATHVLATSSAVINAICDQVDAIPSPTDNNTDIKIVSSPVDNFVSEEKISKEHSLLKGNSSIENNKLATEVKSVVEIEQSDTIKNDTKPKSVPSPKPVEVDHLNDVHVETPPLKTNAASKKDQVGIASVDVAIIEPQETKLPQLITGTGISTAKSAEPVTPEKIEIVDSDKAFSLNQNVSQLELSQSLHNGHKKPSKELGKEQKDNITSIDEQKEPPMECKERPKEPQKQSCEKRNEFQPINAENSNPALKMSSKAESRAPASEAQTRSFTSISDAVRFSLMDMDDGTDSVENQVLQAFQVSQETAPESPSYDNNSSNDGDASVASSAVILTTPQNATTTELSVSRVSQRFEASVHASQTEKFADCQSTVSRTTTWVLDDSSLNETSQVLGGSKSQDIDSSEETKDDERPKKKKKRRDRCERDLEAMHKFWCEICHKGFFSAYNLRRHCRNVHKMDLPKGSTDLPFGQKSSPEMAYANNSQCHKQGESSSSDIVTPPRLAYAQQACVSPKGAEFVLQSPTCENKNQEFPMKSASSQHTTHVQASDFQMQTPPRMPSQSPSAHVSNVSPAKDFRLPASTAASQVQLSPSKMTSATKSPSSPKFQRLPTPCSTATVPQLAKVSQQISQISLCGQPTLQQQMQLSQLQQSVLMQQLPGASCQAQQQLQVAQCPHFQANKQTAQQSIGQLQLMHHAGQLPQVQHATHVVPKQAQVQSYKKCTASQQASKMADSEQLQQAAQLAQTQQAAQLVQTQQAAQMAQTQQMLANQHLQKLMHLRQNAMVATGSTPQLSLATGIQGSPSKASAQCFRAQLAAAQQVAAATASQQRSQGTTYSLAPHNSAAHQFFPPGQSNQDQSNCPHAFTTQNIVEFSTSGPSYPTIRLSSETNDGLEDLEQFLLENMPWSGETAHPHGISQQTGNRPSSADSLTLAIPTSTSQNRTAAQAKNKTSISRPKPRKPNTPSCSKNLIGNLGRSVKKKPPSKKTAKSSDTDCSGLKPDLFLQTSIINQQAHVMDSMHRQCSKGTSSDLLSSKTASKNTAISSINENDSSDSVQCINVNLNPHTKICSNINFSTFPTAEKSINSFCNTDPNSTRLYGEHNKNSFLGQGNLVNKDCSNLGNSSINSSLCDTDPLHAGSPFAFAAKESVPNSRTTFYPNERSLVCPNRPETSTADFLGQRNIENCDLMTSGQRNVSFNTQDTSNNPSGPSTSSATIDSSRPTVSDIHDLFLGGKTANNNNSAVSFKKDSVDIDSGSVTNKVSSLCGGVTVSKIPNSHTKKGESVASSFKVAVSGKKGVIFSDDDFTAPENDDHSKSQNVDVSNCATENHLKQDESASNVSDKNTASILKSDNLPNNGLKIKDINFNYVSSKEELNSSVLISETNCGETKNSLSVSSDTNLKKNLVEYESNEILSNFDNLKQKLVNGENNFCKTEENGLVDSEIKQNDLIDQLITSSPKKGDIIAKSKVLNNCDNDYLKLNYDSKENLSSHKILNGVSHTSELVYSEEENENSGGLRHITLRIHKSQDIVSNNNKVNSKQNLTENSSTDIKKITKKSHKKKSYNNKMNHEVKEMSITKNPPQKLDINSNIHDVGISDVDGIDKNAAQSRAPTLCDKIPVETQENATIFNESKPVLPPEQILPGRLRLRDTPKTSVKRTCPCCVENGTPKKCRTPVNKSPVKIFGTSGQNNKSKPDSKTKNMHKGKKAKANVRSSPRRLRSRNNAIS